MPRRKPQPPPPPPHNFVITVQGDGVQYTESFPTVEQAAKVLSDKVQQLGLQTYSVEKFARYPDVAKHIRVCMRDADWVLGQPDAVPFESLTPEQLAQAFKGEKSGSVVLLAQV